MHKKPPPLTWPDIAKIAGIVAGVIAIGIMAYAVSHAISPVG